MKVVGSNDFPQIRKTATIVFWNHTRLTILILVLTCITASLMNSLSFNFSVICMNDLDGPNSTHWIHETNKKSMLFSAPSIGALIGLLPSVPLISKFGVRYVLSFCGFCSSLGTLLFPITMEFNFYFVVLCRLLQGIGTSVVFTVVGTIPVHWASSDEMGTFLAILSCSFQLSNVFCMPISGILCESTWGWRSIYFIFGIFSLFAYIVFFLYFRDTPRFHRNVSHKELKKIEVGKNLRRRQQVPYREIIHDQTILVSWLSVTGGNTGFFLLVLFGPTYLRDVLHFDVKATGFASALPFLISAAFKFLAGAISDRSTCVSEKIRFTIFAIASQIGLAVGFCIMSLSSSKTVAQIAYTFAIASSGLNVMGVVKCCQIRSRQHVHFVVAMISISAAIIQFIIPILIAIFCPDNTSEQWSRLFICVSIFIIATNIPFPILARDESAEYTKEKLAMPIEEAQSK
ncbi:unnamed protein product [Caenorhabditis bovis]|uniref:Major facilitator superfamily (MFS) profile domain-containing protein n=1 Tax=Caenorhabditis bovis TaxID=2654633 RepID=A0A8S1EAP8_9PELO|nr:unnamed protein product [Caenorhabditis bovis]